jgi:drug/metabolite transporter (DMT)-like permease
MERKESFEMGMMFMLISASALALTGFLGQLGMGYFFIFPMTFWRFLAAFILCMAFLCMRGELKGCWRIHNLKTHLLRAFFVLGAQYTFYYYIQHNNLLNAIVLLNTGPLFIPIIEWGLLRNKVGKSTWISIAVAFIGVIFVLQPQAGIFSRVSFVGLLAGVCQAASQVLFGLNARREKANVSLLYLFFFCTVFSSIPYACIHKTWITGASLSLMASAVIIALAVASIGNQLTRAVAYQYSTPSRLSPFLYFSVLLAGVLDWAVFKITPNTLSLIGASLVVFGGVLKVVLRQRMIKKS